MIDVQYRRLKSNGKIDVHVVQIALFLKYRSTCLSMVSDTVKWSRMDSIRLSGLVSCCFRLVSCCFSTQAVKQVSRMDQIDQMESNGLHSIKPSQMVKWCVVASAERL